MTYNSKPVLLLLLLEIFLVFSLEICPKLVNLLEPFLEVVLVLAFHLTGFIVKSEGNWDFFCPVRFWAEHTSGKSNCLLDWVLAFYAQLFIRLIQTHIIQPVFPRYFLNRNIPIQNQSKIFTLYSALFFRFHFLIISEPLLFSFIKFGKTCDAFRFWPVFKSFRFRFACFCAWSSRLSLRHAIRFSLYCSLYLIMYFRRSWKFYLLSEVRMYSLFLFEGLKLAYIIK